MGWEVDYYRKMLKRVTITIIILLAVLFAAVYLARAWTYEGELDPDVFDTWQAVKTVPTNNPGTVWIVMQNPDPEAAVQRAALLMDVRGNLLGYRYFKQGQPFEYGFDHEEKTYKRKHYTQEQKQRCMQCHPGLYRSAPEDARITL